MARGAPLETAHDTLPRGASTPWPTMPSSMTARSNPTTLRPGMNLGDKYEVLAHIASGGKGEVYRARQLKLGREVAVKIISAEFIRSYDDDQEELDSELERFRREVWAMARLRHPNVLQVHDFDRVEVDGRELDYIVMEYVAGPTLRVTLTEEGLGDEPDRLLDWVHTYFLPILAGVEAAHVRGIIHRDLKPENVILDGRTPKIADFGLAKINVGRPVTRSHHMFGTIVYMAPEQLTDLALTDARADVYSLGKMLYEACVGFLQGERALPLKQAFLPPPKTPLLQHLGRVIRDATAEEQTARLASVETLRERVVAAIGGARVGTSVAPTPRQGRPQRRIARAASAALGLGLVAGLAAWLGLAARASGPTSTSGSSWSTDSAAERERRTASSAPTDTSPVHPPYRIASDGAPLHLVPAGRVVVTGPTGSQRSVVDVPAFYLDEAEVTNHQFVEFLNATRKSSGTIEVAGTVVRGGGDVWLHLGQAEEGYEPIVVRHGAFAVNQAGFASYPVVRVTAEGTAAYARAHRRRLPTIAEWLRAAGGSFSDHTGASRTPFGADGCQRRRVGAGDARGRQRASLLRTRRSRRPPDGAGRALHSGPARAMGGLWHRWFPHRAERRREQA